MVSPPRPLNRKKKQTGRGTNNPERTDIRMGIGMGDCKPAQYCEGKKKGTGEGATNQERTDIGMGMSVGDRKPAPLLEAD